MVVYKSKADRVWLKVAELLGFRIDFISKLFVSPEKAQEWPRLHWILYVKDKPFAVACNGELLLPSDDLDLSQLARQYVKSKLLRAIGLPD